MELLLGGESQSVAGVWGYRGDPISVATPPPHTHILNNLC
uniref:Uncharacterized protein n=1 Tax=Anguilla anguilla TaxID=7936 RepID=A0A0E9VL32_ANGAN